jgi:very-short-patch-repair endonuclease
VTTVARTLLDLAEAAPEKLDRALEEAERRGLFDMRDVEALIVRRRGRHGVRVLEQALGAYRDRPFTRSELERQFGDLCREAGLAPPAFNAWVAGHEVDALWRDQRLVVELDGHAFHRTRAAFERDRLRDADLQLAGYRVVRITHRRLTRYPGAVVTSVRRLLSRDTSSNSCTEYSTSAAKSSRSAIAS